MRSMSKMQELQPKIKALKAKYKKAKKDIGQRRKMNEETMKLYKQHGVNPAGGCLPCSSKYQSSGDFSGSWL